MASSSLYPMLLSLLLLSLSNSLLCSVHRNRKLPQAPSPALVVATAPAAAPLPVSALAPAESPTMEICSDTYAQGMFACMDYLTGGHAKSSASCCSDLREIAKQDVACLCAILTSTWVGTLTADDGSPMNTSRALALPYTCTFPLPSSTKCTALLGPSTVAAAVPGPSASQGTSDISSPPVSLAAAFPVTIFTIAPGIVVSALSLFA